MFIFFRKETDKKKKRARVVLYLRDVCVLGNRAIFMRVIFPYTSRAEESSVLRGFIIMIKRFDFDKTFCDGVSTHIISVKLAEVIFICATS